MFTNNVAEQFKSVLLEIDRITRCERWDYNRTCTEAFEKAGLSCTNAIEWNYYFKFCTRNEVTSRDYVLWRRKMNAYKALLKDNKKQAMDILQIKNETSLDRTCQEIFNMTPGEIIAKKDKRIYKDPFYMIDFEWLNQVNDITTAELPAYNEPLKTVYGVATSQYEEIKRCQNCAELFELNDYEGNFAYILSKELSVDLEKAAEYIQDYSYPYIYFSKPYKYENPLTKENYKVKNMEDLRKYNKSVYDYIETHPRDSRLKEDLSQKLVQTMYFDYEASFNQIHGVLKVLNKHKINQNDFDNKKLLNCS